MGTMTIGEVARRAGVATSTLRYWERVGLLAEPEREGGQRRYRPVVLERLALIDHAKACGFTLEEIKVLLDGVDLDAPPPERWRQMARAKLGEVEEQIRRATAVKRLLLAGLACECVDLASCGLIGEGVEG